MEYSSPKGLLRKKLAQDEIVFAPGAYDALSAKIAAHSGADAVYMTGFGVAGSTLGMPDVGLLSAIEMADRARALSAAAAPVPLIADADSGHGGVLNVARMTRLYEQAGVQCIQLEDQVVPKRCGHMAQKQVVDLTEAVGKINAAVDARTSSDFLVIARTDARAVLGFDEALRRGEAFMKAGADLLFIEAPQSEAEMLKVSETFRGVHLVANMVEDGKTPYLAADVLQDMGYDLVIYPVSSLLVVARTLRDTYGEMLSKKMLPDHVERLGFGEYNAMMGLGQLVPDATE
jgi:2-methylisocitrate lyase-like PEP mutase family enzyme